MSSGPSTEPQGTVPTLAELECLHASLNASEREELLECLLIATSREGTGMLAALQPWLLAAAAKQLSNGLSGEDR